MPPFAGNVIAGLDPTAGSTAVGDACGALRVGKVEGRWWVDRDRDIVVGSTN